MLDTRLFSSSTFRLSLVYMLLFGASALMLMVFIYWSTANYMAEQTDETILADINGLSERYRTSGLVGLTRILRQRIQGRRTGNSVYLLTDTFRRPLIGNLEHWPEQVTQDNEWINFQFETTDRHDKPVSHPVRARTFKLPGGLWLLTGNDISELQQTRARIQHTLILGLGITLILGIIGGTLMSRSLVRRIDAINHVCQEITAKDLSRRVPMDRSGDDFDLLADNINQMLNRIETLMETVRRVSDNIAHDLRTPLSRLRQQLESIEQQTSDPDTHQAIITALQETDTLLNTFSALLRIARIESGEASSAIQNINLNQLLRDLVELYQPLAEDKSQQLELVMDNDFSFDGDRDLFFQALVNLLENAIKYTPTAGTITLATTVDQDGCRLTLSDSGPGISPENREKVFQRFFRLENSRSTPGNGLGLSLVQAVMQQHNIKLQLSDNQPGLVVQLWINSNHNSFNR